MYLDIYHIAVKTFVIFSKKYVKILSKKIKDVLESIKEVVKTIQSNEYELAKKNEQIKNDIDSKISSETTRLSEIILNLSLPQYFLRVHL